MNLVLHQHPFSSYCQKALIALYELELPFSTQLVDDADARAELATLWPMASIFYTRAVHRWDEDGQVNVTRYYRDLMGRASVARVVDEARPWRRIFPLPWPADVDA